ncbi:MAG: capsule assembly Wzi family protein [candidate division KSB1 bacterium]|nr:capsule assembly Wzi family protein [candidate division KSB1 bacterium]
MTTVLLDNRVDENPSYVGKRQSGHGCYAEEAYVLYRLPSLQLLFGRAFQLWGPASSGSLILSDFARPLDQISVRFEHKWLWFSHVSAFLDAIGDKQRYLSAHRLDLRLRRRLWIGLSEAVLYGGEHLPPLPAFHIPVLPLFDPAANDRIPGAGDANILGSIDFSCYPKPGLQAYGQILVDDVQVEREYPGDLEPPEWGWLLGCRAFIWHAFVEAEYASITNRTYKTAAGFTRYTHRNDPLGYYRGSDMDQLWFRGNYWLGSSLRFQVHALYLRQGEGRMDKPFDTPWNVSGLKHYSEPFPTGVVERTGRVQGEVRWHFPAGMGFAEITFGYESVANAGNNAHRHTKGWYYSVRLWLEVGRTWYF